MNAYGKYFLPWIWLQLECERPLQTHMFECCRQVMALFLKYYRTHETWDLYDRIRSLWVGLKGSIWLRPVFSGSVSSMIEWPLLYILLPEHDQVYTTVAEWNPPEELSQNTPFLHLVSVRYALPEKRKQGTPMLRGTRKKRIDQGQE